MRMHTAHNIIETHLFKIRASELSVLNNGGLAARALPKCFIWAPLMFLTKFNVIDPGDKYGNLPDKQSKHVIKPSREGGPPQKLFIDEFTI